MDEKDLRELEAAGQEDTAAYEQAEIETKTRRKDRWAIAIALVLALFFWLYVKAAETQAFTQIVTREVAVEAVVSGYTAEQGCFAGDPIASVTALQVQGPKEKVESIALVRIFLSVGYLQDTVHTVVDTRDAVVRYFDASGTEVDVEGLTLQQMQIDVEIPLVKAQTGTT